MVFRTVPLLSARITAELLQALPPRWGGQVGTPETVILVGAKIRRAAPAFCPGVQGVCGMCMRVYLCILCVCVWCVYLCVCPVWYVYEVYLCV